MRSIIQDLPHFNFQDSLLSSLGWDGSVLSLVLQVCEWEDEEEDGLWHSGDGEIEFFDSELLSATPPLEDSLWGSVADSEVLALHPVARLNAGRAYGMEFIVHLPPTVAAVVDDPVLVLMWRCKSFVWTPFP